MHTAISLLTCVGSAELPASLLAHACRLFSAQRGSLYLVSHGGELVVATHVRADDADRITSALDEPRLAIHLLHRTIPLLVDCVNDPQTRQSFCGGGDCPFTIGIPLQWGGCQIGVIQLVRFSGERALSVDEMELLSQFADLAAAALMRHRTLSMATSHDGAADQLTQAVHVAVNHSEQLVAGLAAVEQERRRIAHDLHDGLRQSLLGAQLQLAALHGELHGAGLDAAARQLDAIQQSLAAADAEMSRIVRALCPPLLANASLAAALLDLGLRWASTAQIAVTFDLMDDPVSLPESTVVALYRIVQETLTNIQRHAQASQATISLRRHNTQLTLTVADNGRGGAAPRSEGIGLFSINERAHAIGASLHISSPPGGGTAIIVTLAVEAAGSV